MFSLIAVIFSLRGRSPLLAVGAALLLLQPQGAVAEPVDEDQLGAWYMYFFNFPSQTSRWGVQGDVQYRNWDLGGDLEQLMLRGGVTWRPESNDATLTLGYANITSGEFGSSNDTDTEHRIYQEALVPQKLGDRVYLTHRFRYEQRWVDDQDFRTRFRYALFMNIPFNRSDLKQGAWYAAFYNELFINGEKDVGDGVEVEYFDRNRAYAAIGYSLSDTLRTQFGYMYQTTDGVDKGQLQLSLHHSF